MPAARLRPGYHRWMSNKILFGFHAVTVRLKTAPASIVEIHVDASRRDQRMRAFVERAQEAGAKLVDSDDARLASLCGTSRHQGVVARVTPLARSELARRHARRRRAARRCCWCSTA